MQCTRSTVLQYNSQSKVYHCTTVPLYHCTTVPLCLMTDDWWLMTDDWWLSHDYQSKNCSTNQQQQPNTAQSHLLLLGKLLHYDLDNVVDNIAHALHPPLMDWRFAKATSHCCTPISRQRTPDSRPTPHKFKKSPPLLPDHHINCCSAY